MAGEPGGWSRISLREANVELIDCDHRTPPATEAGYPYVAIPQLRNGRVELSQARRIRPEHYVEWTRKAKPRPYDVVLSRRCNPGETAFVERGAEFALGQNLVLLRADGTKVYPPFLRWLVRGPEWWEQVGKFINVGAVFDSLKCADIPNFGLLVPTLAEQHAIAHVLGALDDKIDRNRRTNETLESIARAIFKSWFVDFDPVRAKAEGRRPAAIDAATAALFPATFHPSVFGSLPQGWAWTQLGGELELLEVGSRPKGGAVSDGVPSIGAESIVGLGRFDYSKTKYVPLEFFLRMGRGLVQSGDVLVYKDGGRPGEYEPHVTISGNGFPFERCCINEHVYRVRAKSGVGQPYLYFWLTTTFSLDQMRIRGTGVAIPGLNSTAFRSLPLLLPKHSVCEAFNAFATPLLSAVFQNCKQSRTLTSLRDLFLPKLLSGELRICDAEKMVEAHV